MAFLICVASSTSNWRRTQPLTFWIVLYLVCSLLQSTLDSRDNRSDGETPVTRAEATPRQPDCRLTVLRVRQTAVNITTYASPTFASVSSLYEPTGPGTQHSGQHVPGSMRSWVWFPVLSHRQNNLTAVGTWEKQNLSHCSSSLSDHTGHKLLSCPDCCSCLPLAHWVAEPDPLELPELGSWGPAKLQ